MAKDVSERLFTTVSGVPIESVYTRRMTFADFDYDKDLGDPGAAALHPRHLSEHVSRPAVDHAAVQRLRHAPKTPTNDSSTF